MYFVGNSNYLCRFRIIEDLCAGNKVTVCLSARFFSCVCFQTQRPSEQSNCKGNVSSFVPILSALVSPFWTLKVNRNDDRFQKQCRAVDHAVIPYMTVAVCHGEPANKLNCRVYDCWELDAVLCGALWLFLLLRAWGKSFCHRNYVLVQEIVRFRCCRGWSQKWV